MITYLPALDPEQNAGEGYGLAPIGHVVNVKSAVLVEINVETILTFSEGYSWSVLKASIQNAVTAYLLELRRTWANNNATVIRVSQIESRILAVHGVTDIADTRLNGKTSNVTLGKYEIPVLGGVSA